MTDPYDSFDITPRHYHDGVDKLWDALQITGVQDEDVFTLAARKIKDLQARVDAQHKTRDGVPVHIGSIVWDRKGPTGYEITGIYSDFCAAVPLDNPKESARPLVPWAYDSSREVAKTELPNDTN